MINELSLSFDELENEFQLQDDIHQADFKELIEMAKYENSRKMDSWDVAELFHKIVKDRLYEQTFQDMSDLANCLGISKTTISMYCRAVEFDRKRHFDREVFSVNKVYILSTVEDDYDDFLSFMQECGEDIANLSVKFVSERVREYKNGGSTKMYVEIVKDSHMYRVPSNVLKRYEQQVALQDMEDDSERVSFSWRISRKQVAYKTIDKSIYLSKGTGIPEDTRDYWGIEKFQPGEKRIISVKFKGLFYEIIIKKDAEPSSNRTKMYWHQDLASEIERILPYDVWKQQESSYFMTFSNEGDYYLLGIEKEL